MEGGLLTALKVAPPAPPGLHQHKPAAAFSDMLNPATHLSPILLHSTAQSLKFCE